MSSYIIQSETLTGIANAIRSKAGTSAAIATEDMASAITAAGQVPINPSNPQDYAVYIVDTNASGSVNFEVPAGE